MKKKELYIFNGNNRAAVYGIGTYIDQLIKALKNSEWEVNIVYLYAQGNEIETTEKEGYRQINIPFPSRNHPNANQYYAKLIAYLLKDVISTDNKTEYIFHLNFMTNYLLVGCLKKMFKCKIILVSHYTDWSFTLLGDYSKLEKIINKPKNGVKTDREKNIIKNFKEDIKMINKVDRFVCVAQHTLKPYCKLGNIRIDKTTIINNALEDVCLPLPEKDKLRLRIKYRLEENMKIILFAGRLDEVKGTSFLIRAFKRVAKENPQVRLVIAGEGNFSQWLKEADEYWAQIIFTGRLDKKQLYEFYNIADMGVVCSLHEEFGLVALEMMMHALPVIVTKTGGLDEIVEDNVSGLKVPVRIIKGRRQVDEKCLVEKISYLLDIPSYAKELGENGRKRFLEKFELSVFKEKMLNLYQTI